MNLYQKQVNKSTINTLQYNTTTKLIWNNEETVKHV